jgi:hypothetical protein
LASASGSVGASALGSSEPAKLGSKGAFSTGSTGAVGVNGTIKSAGVAGVNRPLGSDVVGGRTRVLRSAGAAKQKSSNTCGDETCKTKKIGRRQNWLLCSKCSKRFHRCCAAPGISNYGFLQLRKSLWRCRNCSNSNLVNGVPPFSFNDDLFNDLNISFSSDTPSIVQLDTNLDSPLSSKPEINFNQIKGLKFGHLNVNGLSGKFDEVKSFLQTYNFHLFSFNELRLPRGFKSSFFEIPGYSLSNPIEVALVFMFEMTVNFGI